MPFVAQLSAKLPMAYQALANETHTSRGYRPKEGDLISDSCGSDSSGDAGQRTSIEQSCKPEIDTTGLESAQLNQDGLTIDEACVVIRCSREWLRRKIHSGEIATYRVGAGLRVTRAAISQVPPEQPCGEQVAS